MEPSISSPATLLSDMKGFVKLHEVIQSNKMCKSHWERNLHQYVYKSDPLFNTFTSIEALCWVLFVRNIDARGWELHLRDSRVAVTKPSTCPMMVALFKPAKLESWTSRRLWWRERRWNWRLGVCMAGHLCTGQHSSVASLLCSVCASKDLARRRGLMVK